MSPRRESKTALLTIFQAAKRLAISEDALKRLLETGALPFVDVSISNTSRKPRKRIRPEDLAAFIKTRHRQEKVKPDRRFTILPDSVLRLL